MRTIKPVRTAALSLLARQPYTARRLALKLSEKGYPQQEIEGVIEWCVGQKYLDDAAWALRAAERKAAKGWDRRKIASYLRFYGISRDDITDALKALETDEYE
ncbi:MAG: recombination regulator RecX [Oscillospiraceae bacterium]|jgi:SOS response regulatory protein OraA/RecX|nr:recombination regulator RecX [Oscillospiraceae bacterium]